jgi:CubicO group peptidase (beta-lactamase class C family)
MKVSHHPLPGLTCVLTAFSAAFMLWAEPSPDWPRATPESVGMDSSALVEMLGFVQERQIPVHSIQIVRDGQLVLDSYFFPYDGRTRHDVASVTKSITSLLVGLAIDRGQIRDVKQRIIDFFPSESPVTRVQGLQTIEHLLTMQSGWDCGFEPNEGRLSEMRETPDWVRFMLNLPMVAEPGTRWGYCSGNCHVLSAVLTQTTGTNALAFAREQLFAPLEIRDAYWVQDPQGRNHGWGDLQLHPLDMARIGQLFLRHGRWGGQQVISEKWVKASVQVHALTTANKDGYGYYWWVKRDDFPGMFEAVGRGGQRITIWPDKNLVIVFTGGGFEPGDLAPFILKSLKADAPLPNNPGANQKLKAALVTALRALAPTPTPSPNPFAPRVSGKTFVLSRNQLGLTSISLVFNDSAEAKLEFSRVGQTLHCPVGLDGVERFSTDKLVELPFACKGRWISERVFRLELDRVGGISRYRFELQFTDDGRDVSIQLTERSGLATEKLTATTSP